jgi:hypothetical protein
MLGRSSKGIGSTDSDLQGFLIGSMADGTFNGFPKARPCLSSELHCDILCFKPMRVIQKSLQS